MLKLEPERPGMAGSIGVSAIMGSLRLRFLLIVLVATLPAVAMAATNFLAQRRAAVADAERQVRSLTQLAARTQQSVLQSTHQLLAALAELPAVRNTNSMMCSRILTSLNALQPQLANLALVNPRGDVICSGAPLPAPVNVADRGYFQAALRTRDFVVGEYQVSRITGRSGLNAALPVLEPDGRLLGLVVAAVDLEWLHQFAASAEHPQGTSLMLLDRNGTVLLGMPDEKGWVGRSLAAVPNNQAFPPTPGQVVTAPGPDGTPYLYSREPLPGTGGEGGLVVLAGIPQAEIRRASQPQEQLLLVTIAAGAIALALAWTAAERLMLRPVTAITAAVRSFATGDLDMRLGPPYPPGEMGNLARSLDRAAELLQPRYNQLHALAGVAVKLSRNLEPDGVLQAICVESEHMLRADAVGIFLAGEAEPSWRMAASIGLSAGYVTTAVLRDETVQRILAPGGPVEIGDLGASIPERLQAYRQEGLSSSLVVPMHHDQQVIGTLVAYRRETGTWDASDKTVAVTLAEQAATALVNARLNQALLLAYDTTLEGWARAVELRDQETEGHSRRVADRTVHLAAQLGFPAAGLVHLRRGALLHDIGKLGVPDHILCKPGPLSAAEWDLMRRHPVLARQLLEPIAFLQPALDIPTYHHEKWNGSGYPYGLGGEKIPLSARIFAVVDVWDALRSNRPYRKAWSQAEALAHIHSQSGDHFDPAIVPVFTDLVTK